MEQKAYEALQPSGWLKGITWEKGLVAAGILLAAFIATKLMGHLVHRALDKRSRGAAFALTKLLTYCLVFAGFLTALGLLGLPVASLLLTSTALIVAVGFSLQHIARDFVSGIAILLEGAIRKNDFVTFGETMGTVQEIGLRSTQLLTSDGTMLVVPNHLLTVNEVSNHSNPIKRARLNVKLPVGFVENIDLIKQILLSVAEGNSQVLSEPPPQVALEGILDAHFQFALVVWVAEPTMIKEVASELRFAIANALVQRGIQFPTPQMVIHRLPHDVRKAS
jgi:small-conductance mechanosensitive channel